jgi:hypothetical protein
MSLISKLKGNAGVVENEELISTYTDILTEDEIIEIGFKVFRDTFIFTSRRLILVDIQGITGKKIEYLSLPYGKITMFSVETVGHADSDAELKIWVGSNEQPIEKKFNRKVNIYDIQKVLASYVLN